MAAATASMYLALMVCWLDRAQMQRSKEGPTGPAPEEGQAPNLMSLMSLIRLEIGSVTTILFRLLVLLV
jgi:hypothetical protein